MKIDHRLSWLAVPFFAALAALLADGTVRADVLTPLELGQVQVGGEIGRRIDVTVTNNLLVLDAEKDFLRPFRSKTAKTGSIGLGKLIEQAVRFAAYTRDERVVRLKRFVVEETIKTQGPDGYIGMLRPDARMIGLWDLPEMGFIIHGLVCDYRLFGEKGSLDAARKAADYILTQWDKMPAEWGTTTISVEARVTGLCCGLLMLYGDTQDRRYLDFVVQKRALPEWDLGIVVGRNELLRGHIYTYLDQCLAQLQVFRLHQDDRLLRPAHRAVRFLTSQNGACITGGAGLWEAWTNDQDGRKALAETCATAYQLRVYDSLMRLEGDSRYGDLMERTIYNSLFAAQEPNGRRIRYYTPLEGDRVYHPGDTYCCPNNYRRIVAELPTMVYYRTKAGLSVNLYTASTATVKLDGGVTLKVCQETDYPSSGHVQIALDPSQPALFSLQLRVPRWCRKPSLSVNGEPLPGAVTPGQSVSIQRTWKAGDRVTLELPMEWRAVLGRQRQAGRVAVMRGPMVFCLDPFQGQEFGAKGQADPLAPPTAPAKSKDRLFWEQDPADIAATMTIDVASLKDVPGGDVVRPGGVAGSVHVSTNGHSVAVTGNVTVRLTEFADPHGRLVYFRVPDLSVGEPDELFSGE